MAASESARAPGAIRQFFDRWLVPYLPYPHFMSLAPLDVLFRLLYRPFAWIPVVYWPRLALLIAFSIVGTIVSLPERIAMAGWLRIRPTPIPKHQAPVFVLGYFRSGTTFLQSLLAADPMLRSPRWGEALFPQAFVVGWTLARYLLIPFLPLARVDEVSPLAPTLPAEDDFALNNWALVSVMAGRAVLPRSQSFYDRFNDLDALTPAELTRWRAYQRRFVEKILLIAGGRRLLLKSPSHTARVRYLLDLFPGAKFVHISRPPVPVFQSNLLLARTLQGSFGLQFPLAEAEQEEIIAHEYLATEQHYLADRELIPGGDLAEVRLQDLSADPIGEVRRIYRELELPFSGVYHERLLTMLASPNQPPRNVHPELTAAQKARAARLEPLFGAFGHDRPRIASARLPPLDERPRDTWAGAVRGIVMALACIAAWYLVDRWLGRNSAILVWPAGIATGYAVLGGETSRSALMGAFSAALVVAALFFLMAGNAITAGYPFDSHLLAMITGDILTTDAIFWGAIGGFVAYWIASGRPA